MSLLSIHWDIQTYDTLSSTQDFCKDLAAQGAEEGVVVQAFSQSRGRGRMGREWVSGEGNLTVSLLLKPDCEAQNVGQLSILVGVALAQAAKKLSEGDIKLKWPNDLFLDGGKCAGILIDSALKAERLEWLVVGVGVNTASCPKNAARLGVERDMFLEAFLDRISVLYGDWQKDGFETIRKKWLECTYEAGMPLNVGAFHDLDAYGNLVVLDDTNALKTISAGDVYLKDLDYAAGD